MIPERSQLEELEGPSQDGKHHYEGYTSKELDALEKARRPLLRMSAEDAFMFGREFVQKLWPDELERFQKTTIIITKQDGARLLRLNHAQLRFWNEIVVPAREAGLPLRVIIVKARQLGFSTLIQALHYFWCDNNKHRAALTISYDDESAIELFGKARYIHDSMWFPRDTARKASNKIEFKAPHGSVFHVRTAGNLNTGRSFTLQHVHMSEVPMYPNPNETVTAVHPTVPKAPNTSIIWESTAKGAVGLFYDQWQEAKKQRGFTPFFAPWFWDDNYSMSFPSDDHKRRFMREMTPSDQEYMKEHRLSPEQMRWREWIITTELNGDYRRFRQEFPATGDEAFLTTGATVFDPDRIAALKKMARPALWTGEAMMLA